MDFTFIWKLNGSNTLCSSISINTAKPFSYPKWPLKDVALLTFIRSVSDFFGGNNHGTGIGGFEDWILIVRSKHKEQIHQLDNSANLKSGHANSNGRGGEMYAGTEMPYLRDRKLFIPRMQSGRVNKETKRLLRII